MHGWDCEVMVVVRRSSRDVGSAVIGMISMDWGLLDGWRITMVWEEGTIFVKNWGGKGVVWGPGLTVIICRVVASTDREPAVGACTLVWRDKDLEPALV